MADAVGEQVTIFTNLSYYIYIWSGIAACLAQLKQFFIAIYSWRSACGLKIASTKAVYFHPPPRVRLAEVWVLRPKVCFQNVV